jgi:cell division protein FtsW
MVYSSSFILSQEVYGDSAFYVKKQLIYLLMSIGMVIFFYKTKITFWIKYAPLIHLFIGVCCAATLFPGIGVEIKGATRWIQVAGFRFQPGEFLKYSTLLMSINYFENFFNVDFKKRIEQTFILYTPIFLLLFQPDFGSFMICFISIAVVCYFSTFPRKYFYSFLIAGILAIIPILISQPYRVRRLFSYLDPWKNAKTTGFQIIQSYMAFANGSIFGQGLGNSNEKLFYLPEAHNDFIFSVIGEETGFVGVLVIISLFLILSFLGFSLALLMKEKKVHILVAALVSALTIQILLNMGVVLGLLPTKGLNLPFISSGGSSLIANFFAIGLIASAVKFQKIQNTKLRDFLGTSGYAQQTPNY